MKPFLVPHRDTIGSLSDRRTVLGWALSFAALVCAVQAAHAASPDPAAFNGFDVANASVPLNAIQRGGPPKDGIPAIDRPKFLPASQAALSDGDRILGLALDGAARAYPVRILNWHEVVNDRVGDRAVTVTYCPLCGTGMAFDARLPAGTASFGVSGLLYNSDVLLFRSRNGCWASRWAAFRRPIRSAFWRAPWMPAAG